MRKDVEQMRECIEELTAEIKATMYKEADVTPCDVAHILELRRERDKLIKEVMFYETAPDMENFDKWYERIMGATFIIMLIVILVAAAIHHI